MAIKQIIATLPYQDPTGAALAGGLLTLDLSQPATATGSGEVAPLRVDVILNSTGKFSAVNLWANDQLLPTGTTYHLQVYNSNGLLVADFGSLSIVGASPIDISLLVPVSGGGGSGFVTGAVLLNPATSQTVAQPTGTSLFVNRFENVRYADEFTGATADLKIIAALADLPAGGGTVDCHGFGGSVQTIASTVAVGTNQTLLCDPATQFQPSTAALNMFTLASGARIDGVYANVTNVAYSGAVFSFPGSYADDSHTSLSRIRINSSGVFTGDGILMSASSLAQSIAFVSLTNIRIFGGLNGVHLVATGGGFVNGNEFTDVHVSYAVNCYNFNASGTASAVAGNEFSSVDAQAGPSSVNAILLTTSGTSTVNQNIFAPIVWWDFVAGGQFSINVSGAGSSQNTFFGRWDGPINDTSSLNSYFGPGITPFNSGGISTQGTIYSLSVGGADTFNATVAGTGFKDLHLSNTGGNLIVGVDSSTGSAFGNGNYVSNWFSPSNNSAFTTPVAAFSGQLTQNAGLTVSSTISSGTAAMTTALIAGGAIGTTVSVVASGALATDTIVFCFNAAVTANPGVLVINAWPTSGHVNFQYANPTAAGVTPTAATLNWKVVR
jgi:hypothetical protein